ncbi:MAG: hypothetical protein JXA78_10005 [Anaerolineales bacterium]|nr:hypothetical protein [Anaerolineales bacterium]
MTDDFGTPNAEASFSAFEEQPKKSNSKIWIIIIVLVVLCCCCVVVGGAMTWLWYNGDALLEEFGAQLPYLLA